MFEFFERGFLATVGVLSMSREKTQEMVDELVKRGDLNREEGLRLVDKIIQRGQEEQNVVRKLVRQELNNVLTELDLPTKKEFNELSQKIDWIINELTKSKTS